MNKPHRDTLYLESAEILSHEAFAGEQFILRVAAPECATKAQPGSFVHLQCDPLQPMRRPISIMRVSPEDGWVDLLYKRVGTGTTLLSRRQPGESVSLLGPIGHPFRPDPSRTKPLLIGGGVGMPPMVFLAESLYRERKKQPFVILGSEVPFPFNPQPSQLLLPELPADVIATMPLMDDWGIPCRLASQQDFAGCFQGYVTELARHWLTSLNEQARGEVEIFSCGPHPMLEAVAELAAEFDLPCQVSLEEFMACGVGGCAGCVVEVQTAEGPVMQRVCVDGPVFEASKVF
ncbi:dihydroorotate dehydrogenase electron transfer subunit [endosymbiont of Lamellibrachia barhami]|uniref:dihydroorotate dehydrogenase electron transfer subunit n=1 Tax=endosymbiont of Lamellibrachia barhami TaxID=205975 RepID=UPI0015A88CB5|nr:dihydroorotate dehydrogenase electron transfer subunit [endosymbiont of Lamellibrachia barhami]